MSEHTLYIERGNTMSDKENIIAEIITQLSKCEDLPLLDLILKLLQKNTQTR